MRRGRRGWRLAACTLAWIVVPGVDVAGQVLSGGRADSLEARARVKPVASETRHGLAEAFEQWQPDWLDLKVAWRGRAESGRALVRRDADYDTYLLSRLRITSRLRANDWLAFGLEGQDSHGFWHGERPAPRTVSNVFDLRQGHVEAVGAGARLFARVGRQEFRLGDGRLIASPDWGNTNRTFDLARVRYSTSRVGVDLFGGAPVLIHPRGLDEPSPTERVYGGHVTIGGALGRVGLDPYVYWKSARGVAAESGGRGHLDIVTFGARIAGPVARGLALNAEWAVQRGGVRSDEVRAWAGHTAVVWTPTSAAWKARITVDSNLASGDHDPADGRRQTFDQLYPTNHNRYGQADVIGWRNLVQTGVLVDLAPHARLSLSGGLHDLRLRTARDALYSSGGVPVVRNPSATSTRVGTETDVAINWTIARELSIGAGLGIVWSGGYLRESTDVRRHYAPYVTGTVSF